MFIVILKFLSLGPAAGVGSKGATLGLGLDPRLR